MREWVLMDGVLLGGLLIADGSPPLFAVDADVSSAPLKFYT